MPVNLRSNVLYKFSCGRCNATYYGNAYRHLKVWVGEHSGVSPLIGKKAKCKTIAVKDHMLFCDHLVSLEDFKILASSNSEFHLQIKEGLLISRDKPELNQNEKFLSFLNTLFVQGLSIITIVLLVHCNF